MYHPNRPFGSEVVALGRRLSQFDHHYVRRLSEMRGAFADVGSYQCRLEAGDAVVYEVYELRRPEVAGELLAGLSIVHPGLVGQEWFMTKGHFHAVRETAEFYYCLRGGGLLLMEDEAGEWSAEDLRAGRLVYVPPGWAHRSVNLLDNEDLVTLFVYPGHAGHDYGVIEERGFRKLVVRRDGRPVLVDNPAWLQPGMRRSS